MTYASLSAFLVILSRHASRHALHSQYGCGCGR